MKQTLTRLYKANGVIVLVKALELGWISETEKQQIIENN